MTVTAVDERLRQIEAILDREISNLGYPVGMGLAPPPDTTKRIAGAIAIAIEAELLAARKEIAPVAVIDERLLTPERLAELRAVAEKATPGEWERRHDDEVWMANNYVATAGDELDATHIVNFSPSTAIALIDALEAARKEIAGLREGLRRVVGLTDEGLNYRHERMDGSWSRLSSAPAMVAARNLLAGGNSNGQ